MRGTVVTLAPAAPLTWSVTVVSPRGGRTKIGSASGPMQLRDILMDARLAHRTVGAQLELSCSHHGIGQVLREAWDGKSWQTVPLGGAS